MAILTVFEDVDNTYFDKKLKFHFNDKNIYTCKISLFMTQLIEGNLNPYNIHACICSGFLNARYYDLHLNMLNQIKLRSSVELISDTQMSYSTFLIDLYEKLDIIKNNGFTSFTSDYNTFLDNILDTSIPSHIINTDFHQTFYETIPDDKDYYISLHLEVISDTQTQTQTLELKNIQIGFRYNNGTNTGTMIINFNVNTKNLPKVNKVDINNIIKIAKDYQTHAGLDRFKFEITYIGNNTDIKNNSYDEYKITSYNYAMLESEIENYRIYADNNNIKRSKKSNGDDSDGDNSDDDSVMTV